MKAAAAAHDRAGSALSIVPPPPAPTKLRAPQQTSLQTTFRPWRNLKAPTQFRPARRPQVRRWPIAGDAPTTLPASLENPRGPIPPACAAPVPASRRARPAAVADRTTESSAGLFPAPQAPTARENSAPHAPEVDCQRPMEALSSPLRQRRLPAHLRPSPAP